jgi:hypothetical protein
MPGRIAVFKVWRLNLPLKTLPRKDRVSVKPPSSVQKFKRLRISSVTVGVARLLKAARLMVCQIIGGLPVTEPDRVSESQAPPAAWRPSDLTSHKLVSRAETLPGAL